MLKDVEDRMNHLKSHAILADATSGQVKSTGVRSFVRKVKAASALTHSMPANGQDEDLAGDLSRPWIVPAKAKALVDPGTRLGHFLTFTGATAADGKDKNQHKFQNEHFQMELAFFELAKVRCNTCSRDAWTCALECALLCHQLQRTSL